MTFETLALIIGAAIIPLFIIARLIIKILKFKKSYTVDAVIIGYKKSNVMPIFNSFKPLTGFYPIIKYSNEGEEITSIVKSLSLIMKKNTQLKIRLTKDSRYLSTDFSFEVFAFGIFGLVLMVSTIGSAFIGQYIITLIIAITVAFTFLLYDQHKNLGTLQDTLIILTPVKCPDKYEDMTEDYFKKIEESDIVSYEEAIAYSYNKNKKSQKIQYLIATLLIAYISYNLLS